MYIVPCCYGSLSDCGEDGCLSVSFVFVRLFLQFVYSFFACFLLVCLVCGIFFVRLRCFVHSLLISLFSLCSCFNGKEGGMLSESFKSRLMVQVSNKFPDMYVIPLSIAVFGLGLYFHQFIRCYKLTQDHSVMTLNPESNQCCERFQNVDPFIQAILFPFIFSMLSVVCAWSYVLFNIALCTSL